MTVFVARWRSCPSSRRSRRFGGPYAAFFVAALCFVALSSSAEAQNATPGIVLDVGDAMTVREPVQTTYRMKLATKPTGNVNVWVGSNSDGSGKSRYVAFGVIFTFSPTNWSEWATMSLGTGHDSDGDNHTVKLHHVVRPTYLSPPTKPPLYTPIPPPDEYKGVKKTLTISELDDDRVVVLSSPKVTVPEGGTKTYTAKLKVEPYNQVTVTVARKSGDSNLTVNPTSLTFTTNNWDTAQTLTLSAAEDSDNAHGSAVFTHTTSANYEGIPTELTAVENDNDVGLNLPSSVSVPEGGTESYEVTLNSQPTANVTVSVARKSTGGQDQDLSVQSGTSLLTFTTQNWNTPQTVTLAADEEGSRSGGRSSDPFDGEDGSAVFTHTVSGGNYNNVGVAELTATEADNDRKLIISSDTFYEVREGRTETYKVKLKSQPTANVTVKVALKSGDPHLSVSAGASLTFTPNNYNTDQTVTLAAAEDADYVNGSAVFTHTVSGGNWNVVQEETFTEQDNDTLKKKPVLPSPVYVPEEGTLAVPVILGTQPQSSVTVTVAKTINFNPSGCLVLPSPGDTDLTASPSTFTFTSTNWFTPQIVTLSAADDSDDTDNCDAFKFTASGDSGSYSGAQTLEAYESDNDVSGRALVLSPTSVSVPEGSTASYTVKLASAPSESVTVTVARKTTGTQDTDLTVDTDSNTEGNQDTLTFTTTQGSENYWNTAQTVTLSAADDPDDVDGTAVFTHIPAGPWRSAAADLTARELDKDLSAVSLIVGGSGGDGTGLPTIEAQRYVKDFPIAALTLPAATGGRGITYTLSGPLPVGLTFDPATRVLSGTPTELQDAVSYTYTATDGKTSDTLTFTIAVDEDTAPGFVDPRTLAPLQIPNQTYVVNEAITALTLPEATGGNPPITYTLAEAGAGPQGRTRAATDTGAPGAAATLPAGLTFDPETRVLSGEPTVLQQPRTYVYTAIDYNGSRATLEFTIAVEEEKVPTFGDQTIAPQTYVQDTAIRPLTLPAATGGNGRLTYALSALPAGLTFDSATRVLAGTPTEVQPATRYTYTVTDEDGDPAPETVTVTITILSAAEKQILKDVLAAQGRALLSSATGVIGQRFRLPGMPSGGVLGACTGASAPAGDADAPPEATPAEAGQEEGGEVPRGDRASECLSGILDAVAHGLAGVRGGGGVGDNAVAEPWRSRGPDVTRMGSQPAWNWESLIWGQSFALPLSGSGTEAGPSAWTLWGAGDVQGFNGTPRQGQYDGQMYSLYLGLDKRWAERWLAGAAVARSWGTTDYEAGGGGSAGQVETSLTSVYPYVRGAFESGLEVWALGGYGRGKAENTRQGGATAPGGSTGTSARASSDLSMFLGATGARQPMTEWGGVQLALVGGAGYVTLATDEGAPLLGNLAVTAHRTRLAVEVMGQYEALAPYVQVGGRYDGGDGQTGAGLETVAGVRYTSERVAFEARGRWLATHAAAGYEEYGGLARLAVQPRADGTGLFMAVSPRWGAAEGAGLLGGGDALLDGGAVPGMGMNRMPSATTRVLSVESELGYGFRLFDGQGVLTPYGGFALTGQETRQYRVGGRLGVAQWLNVSLEGTRQEGTQARTANQGVQLQLEGRF